MYLSLMQSKMRLEEDFTLPHRFQMESTWKYEFHLESRWNFFAGSPAKLLTISTWNPGGIQVES
jgi:hypothetical protein